MLILGIDMAFANMGLVIAEALPGLQLKVLDLKLITTTADTSKQLRKSSEELRRARESVAALRQYASKCSIAVAEVPSGSQSASAARALGIAVGILSSCPIPIIEVSPREVKLASVGVATASKADMIKWATSRWPEAPWKRIKRKGVMHYANDNEHLADACAAVVAGLNSSTYQLMEAAYGLTCSPHLRSSSDSEPQGQLSLELVSVARQRVRVRGG